LPLLWQRSELAIALGSSPEDFSETNNGKHKKGSVTDNKHDFVDEVEHFGFDFTPIPRGTKKNRPGG
jgi:hypothetical protein